MKNSSPDFKIDAIVTVDLKGQILLPKNVREKTGFEPNEKIALLSLEKDGELCCLLMIKAEKLGEAVTKALGSNPDLKL
jgi:antitoxin PrlF